MTQLATASNSMARFSGVVLTNASVRFRLSERGDERWVRVERIGSNTGDNEFVEAQFGLTTGSHHMQVFWLPDEAHGCQIGFPFTWLIPEQRWVPRNSTFIRPPSVEHQTEAWNFVCARCHATGARPNLDRTTLSWHTEVGELGIACEACHGPGKAHVEIRKADGSRGIRPHAEDLRREIVQPARLDGPRSAQVCGYCHSMKLWEPGNGWPNREFAYRPGDELEKLTPVLRLTDKSRPAWMNAQLAQDPDIVQDFFWKDGMIRVSGREYNGVSESPCYRGGNFSCVSCHSMHDSDPDDQLGRTRGDNRACIQCHSQLASPSQLVAHSHHREGSTGSQCYNCHMPHTTYGVLSAIRSHQISSPRVADDLATGRPNACTLCHLDKSLAWTERQLTAWYGQPSGASGTGDEMPHALRLGLAGDAGQRVLIAWHLSWPPAVSVSGPDRILPVLAQLLDDSYAAVRCVAERSMKALLLSVPADYDFTFSPGSRPKVSERISQAWLLQEGEKGRSDQAHAFLEQVQQLVRSRKDPPVRLRE